MRLTQVFTILESDQTNGTLVKMGKAYDAGAKRILSDVANVKLLELEKTNQVVVSKETREKIEKVNSLYHTLLLLTQGNKELNGLIYEYENQTSSLLSSGYTDSFIQGFLTGYNFSQASNERDEF